MEERSQRRVQEAKGREKEERGEQRARCHEADASDQGESRRTAEGVEMPGRPRVGSLFLQILHFALTVRHHINAGSPSYSMLTR